MPMMVSIARITDVQDATALPEYRAEHARLFGEYADLPRVLREKDDRNMVAVVGQVHDIEGLRSASRTPEGDAFMRRYGFIEQLSFFLEE